MKELREKKNCGRMVKFAALCAAFLLFAATGLTGWAAKTGTVRVDNVNVRAEASTEANRVCKLPINTVVNVLDEATGNDGKVWYSISFTLDGADKNGWIRSDMLSNITETESSDEGSAGSGSAYTIQEPIESYEASDALTQTTLTVGEESVTAWQVSTELTDGEELYLVAAKRSDGSIGWFYYDPSEGTFQRDLGQFAGNGEEEPEGLIQALQNELTELKETTAKQLSMRLYLIIGLGALCVLFLILAIVFIVKYRNEAYEYYDDDEDDDEDEDDEEDDDEDDDDEEDDDDDDDFFAALEAGKKKPVTSREEEEELPEIDMSTVLEVEEEAKKESPIAEAPAAEEPKAAESDELEDFDIEILDWEDLGI